FVQLVLFIIVSSTLLTRLFPFTTLFRSRRSARVPPGYRRRRAPRSRAATAAAPHRRTAPRPPAAPRRARHTRRGSARSPVRRTVDRKSTRLNSSHVKLSYAVFCLKKKIY